MITDPLPWNTDVIFWWREVWRPKLDLKECWFSMVPNLVVLIGADLVFLTTVESNHDIISNYMTKPAIERPCILLNCLPRLFERPVESEEVKMIPRRWAGPVEKMTEHERRPAI